MAESGTLVKHIYACWDAKDPNSDEILAKLKSLPHAWVKMRKNHTERCSFLPPVVTHYAFDRNKNSRVGTKIASFGVPEYCFDAFDSYVEDVSAIMSEYGYFEKGTDTAEIDKFFGIPFMDMTDWPSDT